MLLNEESSLSHGPFDLSSPNACPTQMPKASAAVEVRFLEVKALKRQTPKKTETSKRLAEGGDRLEYLNGQQPLVEAMSITRSD